MEIELESDARGATSAPPSVATALAPRSPLTTISLTTAAAEGWAAETVNRTRSVERELKGRCVSRLVVESGTCRCDPSPKLR